MLLSILLSSYNFHCNLRVWYSDWCISLLRALLSKAAVPQGDHLWNTVTGTAFEYENLSSKSCTVGSSLKKYKEHCGVKGSTTESYLRETWKQKLLLIWQQKQVCRLTKMYITESYQCLLGTLLCIILFNTVGNVNNYWNILFLKFPDFLKSTSDFPLPY